MLVLQLETNSRAGVVFTCLRQSPGIHWPVTAIVNSFIMPLVQIVYPPIAPAGAPYELSGGPILDSLITFVIVAFVIFIIVKIGVGLLRVIFSYITIMFLGF